MSTVDSAAFLTRVRSSARWSRGCTLLVGNDQDWLRVTRVETGFFVQSLQVRACTPTMAIAKPAAIIVSTKDSHPRRLFPLAGTGPVP